MSNQRIIVDITGKSTEFVKSANTAAQALTRFNSAIAKTASETENHARGMTRLRAANGQYISTVDEAKRVVAQLRAEKERLLLVDELIINNLSKEDAAFLRNAGLMQNMHMQAGGASFALLSLAQGLQDSAQFGMGAAQGLRAVNNNLQQFVTSLAFASSASGGFGKLMKDLKSAFWGPTGFIIAFSAASAAMEFFALRSQRAKKEAEDLGKAWDDAAGNLFKFEDALSGMSIGIPERAITPIREELERTIKGYDDVISKAEETITVQKALRQSVPAQGLAGVVSVPQFEQLVELSKEEIENNQAIIAAKETVAGYDMDRIEGERRLLSLLVQQEGFLDKRNQLLEIARGLGLSLESTSKKTLTDLQKLAQQYEDLFKAFSGSGEGESQMGALLARIDLLKGLRDITVDYSQNIEAMRLAMSEEGVIVEQETARLARMNKQLEERLRLRRQILGIEQIGSEQLRTLSEYTVERINREIEATNKRREAEEKAMASRISMFNQMGAELVASIASAGGGLDEFHRMFGSFLSRWGIQLIKMGLAEMKFGAAIEAIRQAIKVPGGGFVAAAAGVALVAIGRSLKARTREASTAGGSSAVGSLTSANYITSRPGYSMFQSGGMTEYLYGGFPQTSPQSAISFPGLLGGGYGNPGGYLPITLVAAGRDLVSAVDSELAASGRSTSNSPFVTVGSGQVIGGSLGGDRII